MYDNQLSIEIVRPNLLRVEIAVDRTCYGPKCSVIGGWIAYLVQCSLTTITGSSKYRSNPLKRHENCKNRCDYKLETKMGKNIIAKNP